MRGIVAWRVYIKMMNFVCHIVRSLDLLLQLGSHVSSVMVRRSSNCFDWGVSSLEIGSVVRDYSYSHIEILLMINVSVFILGGVLLIIACILLAWCRREVLTRLKKLLLLQITTTLVGNIWSESRLSMELLWFWVGHNCVASIRLLLLEVHSIHNSSLYQMREWKLQ